MNNINFLEILKTLDLSEEKKDLIQSNIDLFNIVFKIGFEKGSMNLDNELFTSSGLGLLHDVVYDVLDLSLNDKQLKNLFYKLPAYLQKYARHHGLNDTCVGDNIYEYLEEEGLPK